MAAYLIRAFNVLRELRDGGPGTRFAIASSLDMNVDTVWHVLRVAVGEGLVRRCGKDSTGAVVYEIAPTDHPKGESYNRWAKPDTSVKGESDVESTSA